MDRWRIHYLCTPTTDGIPCTSILHQESSMFEDNVFWPDLISTTERDETVVLKRIVLVPRSLRPISVHSLTLLCLNILSFREIKDELFDSPFLYYVFLVRLFPSYSQTFIFSDPGTDSVTPLSKRMEIRSNWFLNYRNSKFGVKKREREWTSNFVRIDYKFFKPFLLIFSFWMSNRKKKKNGIWVLFLKGKIHV